MSKILIIDDEDDIRLALKTLLESEGYEVVDTNTGRKGLAVLKKGGIDLVLLDFFMPGMNGRQVLEEIRGMKGSLKKSKVILLTVAVFGKEGSEKLKELQVSDYIQKPFVNKNLLARIRKALAK
jgi:CheY-like chemotaxis protein